MSKVDTFRYSKELLFAEFDVAKKNDAKLKGRKYKHQLEFCKEHQQLEKEHPEWYEMVDIKWDNLVLAYSAPDPRDHFYMKVFGKTYQEKMHESKMEKDYHGAT